MSTVHAAEGSPILHSEPRAQRQTQSWSRTEVRTETTRVLLVEDDAEMRRMLREALEDAGYEVDEATDGRRFLAAILAAWLGKRPMPDLVISDIRIPHLSGLEVLEQIRREDWAMPVVLITAFGDRPTHAEAARLGALAVIDKPFELDDLIDRILDVLPPRF